MKLIRTLCITVFTLVAFLMGVLNVHAYDNQDAFEYFKENNYIETSNYLDFQPAKVIAKAEFFKLLLLSSGKTNEDFNGCINDYAKRNWRIFYYQDVLKTDWFASYVCLAEESGYLKKRTKFFKPESSITWLEGIKHVMTVINPEGNQRMLSENIKKEFEAYSVLLPQFLFKEMTRGEAVAMLYAVFGNETKEKEVVEEKAEKEDSKEEVGSEEIIEEEEEEISQERKSQLKAIARTQPGTGGYSNVITSTGGGVAAPVSPVCGNGVVESGEQCDGGDNCSDQCTIIPTFNHTPVIPNSNSRLLYVWSHWPNLKNNPTAEQEFIDFLNAPHDDNAYAVSRIVISGASAMDFSSESDLQAMREFIALASSNNIAVEYLSGDPNWVRTGSEERALDRCQNIINFNASTVETNDNFTGIHFDIEPHTLGDEWSQNNGTGVDNYNDEFQNNFISIMRECKEMIIENEQNLALTAAIPVWYQSSVQDLWNPFSSSDSPLDYIAIMNYTDNENTFTSGVSNNITNTQIPLTFVAEINENNNPSITFYEEGYLEMENMFSNIKSSHGGNSNFAGFAIHYYGPYTTMIDEVPALTPSDCYNPDTSVDGPVNQTRVWPISGGMSPVAMSSPFGPRLQASQGYAYDFHRGIDIPVPTGTPVYAVADGVVTTLYLEGEAGSPYPSGGTVVGIRHEDQGTYYSLYMHLDSFNVTQDQVITKGEQIGLSGMTGATTFEHLHFEIRENTIDSGSEPHINPFNYLPYANTTTHILEIVSPELIDSLNPTIQLHTTVNPLELDINKLKVSVYDNQCNLLEEKEVDFNERTNSGSDNATENNVDLQPAQFNTNSTVYELDIVFSGLTGSNELLIVAESVDINGNTVYAESPNN